MPLRLVAAAATKHYRHAISAALIFIHSASADITPCRYAATACLRLLFIYAMIFSSPCFLSPRHCLPDYRSFSCLRRLMLLLALRATRCRISLCYADAAMMLRRTPRPAADYCLSIFDAVDISRRLLHAAAAIA